MTPRPSLPHPAVALPASSTPVYLGMWTWLFQRAASFVLMILLPWHRIDPYSRPVRIAVLFSVIFHAAAGVRFMLTDFGLAEHWQRGLIWLLAAIGLSIFLYFALSYV
jgi:succinate dehydrogenase hydrophobic anchor subunit